MMGECTRASQIGDSGVWGRLHAVWAWWSAHTQEENARRTTRPLTLPPSHPPVIQQGGEREREKEKGRARVALYAWIVFSVVFVCCSLGIRSWDWLLA